MPTPDIYKDAMASHETEGSTFEDVSHRLTDRRKHMAGLN